MAAGTFQKNSLGWQIQQLSRRVGEWLERLLSVNQDNRSAPLAVPDGVLWTGFWLLVLALAAWAGWQLYRWLRPYWATYWRNSLWLPAAAEAVSRSTTDWLQQARRAHAQGDDQEACRALYMATLQHLSDRQLISLQASRTDGEYLTLMRTLNLPPPYQVVIQTHERLWFGQVSASPAVYERCWQAYQEIERA
ncbi:MAG: DUF4129 domain-containing protein [Synechococcales cyanobacterium C42_A2020_086]|nr:DUF4129 domain-containing protein [Synechococcales cyanobacterium C42_A2020_086]